MSSGIKNKPYSERMTTALRKQLSEGMVEAMGVYDAYTARIAEKAGFKALHLTGMGVEISQIGGPDIGLMTLTELASHAARIAGAVNIPILADIDTGFGGVLNVNRTIREMERAGIAGVHMEDQVMPKHCPLLAGRAVLSREEAVAKIKAAVDARTDEDFVIVARTDADVISLNELIERSNLYLEAGADMVMPMLQVIDGVSYYALSPEKQMEYLALLPKEINGPVMGIGAAAPRGFTSQDMADAGYKFMMYAGEALSAAGNALEAMYKSVLENGTSLVYQDANPGIYNNPLECMKVVHLDEYAEMEGKYI